MHAAILGVAVGLLGFEVGWRRLPDGWLEYTIQLDAEDLGRLARLEEGFLSDVPAGARNIARFRIVFGTAPVSRDPLDRPQEVLPERTSYRTANSERRPGLPWLQGKLFPPETLSAPLVPGGQPVDRSGAGQPGTGGAKTPAAIGSDRRPDAGQAPAEPPRPWVPFGGALAALFGSLGANLYLGWMVWETRRRWRTVLRKDQTGRPQSSPPQTEAT